MAKILIDIPDEAYKNLLNNYSFSNEEIPIISLAIATGTPLPKGHGRLIDASKLPRITEHGLDGTVFSFVPYLDVDTAPTIIEADKDGE